MFALRGEKPRHGRQAPSLVTIPEPFRTTFDVPKQLEKDSFWGTTQSQRALQDYFGDVHMPATDTGTMNRAAA